MEKYINVDKASKLTFWVYPVYKYRNGSLLDGTFRRAKEMRNSYPRRGGVDWNGTHVVGIAIFLGDCRRACKIDNRCQEIFRDEPKEAVEELFLVNQVELHVWRLLRPASRRAVFAEWERDVAAVKRLRERWIVLDVLMSGREEIQAHILQDQPPMQEDVFSIVRFVPPGGRTR